MFVRFSIKFKQTLLELRGKGIRFVLQSLFVFVGDILRFQIDLVARSVVYLNVGIPKEHRTKHVSEFSKAVISGWVIVNRDRGV
jgi:hypothetical protein